MRAWSFSWTMGAARFAAGNAAQSGIGQLAPGAAAQQVQLVKCMRKTGLIQPRLVAELEIQLPQRFGVIGNLLLQLALQGFAQVAGERSVFLLACDFLAIPERRGNDQAGREYARRPEQMPGAFVVCR